jgi:hypothetical protein
MPSGAGTGCKSMLGPGGPSSAPPKPGWPEVLAATRQPEWLHCPREEGGYRLWNAARGPGPVSRTGSVQTLPLYE